MLLKWSIAFHVRNCAVLTSVVFVKMPVMLFRLAVIQAKPLKKDLALMLFGNNAAQLKNLKVSGDQVFLFSAFFCHE